MEVFTALLIKIIPFYILIALGYWAGNFLKTDKKSISALLIYIVNPIVIFSGVLGAKADARLLLIPLIVFLTATSITLFFYFTTKKLWKDSTGNLLAAASGSANAGYFGIPVALTIYGEQVLPIAVLVLFGIVLYQNTIAYYLIAKGGHSEKESLKKVLKLPSIYAFILAILFNLNQIDPGAVFHEFADKFIGAYSILGMMVVGMGITKLHKIKLDYLFIILSLLAKFIVWPLIIISVILIDNAYFNLLTSDIYKVLLLMSIVPMATNNVVFAAELGIQPEKMAITVVISTLVTLLLIPGLNAFLMT